MSSSSANTLRRPARKMACVSATITRTNAPFALSSPAPRFSSTLTGVPAIILRLCAFEVIFVDHTPDAAATSIFEAAYYASTAIDLHVAPRPHDIGGQQDREVDHRSHGHIFVHGKQHAVGGNIFRLRH